MIYLNNRKHTNRCRLLSCIILLCLGVSAFADTPQLFELLLEAKDLYHSDKDCEALSILNKIEDECFLSDNDTIKVVFYETKGSILFFQREYREALKFLSEVPTLYERINLRDINYLEAFLALGVANQKIGNTKEAERYYRRGLLKSVLINQPNKFRENIYLNLGNLYLEQNDSTLAQYCFSRMNANSLGGLVNASLDEDEILDDSEMQAIKMREEGDFESAILVYNSILSYIKERIGTHNEDYIRILYSKAIVVGFNLGRMDEGIQLCEEIISYKEYMPTCQEDIIGAYGKLLQYLAYQGEKGKIDSILPDALAYVSGCSNSSEKIALFYRIAGNGAYWNKHYDIAITFYEKYLETGVREKGDSYLEIPNMLAVSYIRSNDYSKAIPLLDNLIKSYTLDIDSNLDLKSQIFHNLGRAYMLAGNKQRALVYLTESNDIWKSKTGQDNPKTIEYITACQE